MNNVNQELGKASPYTQTVSLNDSDVRSLFQKTTAGSAISMSDGWGKSNVAPASQVEWTTPNTYSWTVPAGVTSISAVAVSGGGGGPRGGCDFGGQGGTGGSLFYKNNISVTPGETLTIVVGAGGSGGTINGVGTSGGASSITRSGTALLSATVGGAFDYLSSGGSGDSCGGGGGAGGYSSSGQVASGGNAGGQENQGSNGTYGASGGGGGGYDDGCWNRYQSGNGGSTYLYGRGDNGVGGAGGDPNSHYEGYNGGDGSATNIAGSGTRGNAKGGSGGAIGGYNSDDCGDNVSTNFGYAGAAGAVRIIWGDASISRSFPATNTKNV